MIRELASHFGHSPDDISIKTIGTKPGEKLYEELMTQEETRRTIELERYFAVKPAFSSLYKNIEYSYPATVSEVVDKAYNSANEEVLTQAELRDSLYENDLLEGELEEEFWPDQRFWGDEKK